MSSPFLGTIPGDIKQLTKPAFTHCLVQKEGELCQKFHKERLWWLIFIIILLIIIYGIVTCLTGMYVCMVISKDNLLRREDKTRVEECHPRNKKEKRGESHWGWHFPLSVSWQSWQELLSLPASQHDEWCFWNSSYSLLPIKHQVSLNNYLVYKYIFMPLY